MNFALSEFYRFTLLFFHLHDESRLFHWRGHKLPLPLPEEEPVLKNSPTDNSTTCLMLDALSPALNDIYACIDAQVWLPETNAAHFLDGMSFVLAFEIDRKSHSQSGWNNQSESFVSPGEVKSPFKLEAELWVDRYLLDKRHRIAELREEISRIEGEADVSLERRDHFGKSWGE